MLRYARLIAFVGISGFLTVWIGAEITGFERSPDRYEFTATFADVGTLDAGDPVKLAGVRVGSVGPVRLVAGEAVVRFTVDRDVELPVDSTVAVQAQDLLGRRLLAVKPGESGRMLADGDVVAEAASAVELGDLVNELGPLLEAVRPDQVNALVTALDEALRGNRDTISGLTADLATVLDTAASRSETIASLTDDYALLVDEVARRDQSIQRLLENLVRLTETFQASADVLVTALDTLPGPTGALQALLADNAEDLDALLADLSTVTHSVRPSLDEVDRILAGLPLFLEDAWSLFDEGEYIKINFSCVSATPPPCPHPLLGRAGTGEDADLGQTLLGVLGL